jgi:hypothetical protein
MITFKNGKAYCDGEVYTPYTPQICACCDKCALCRECSKDVFSSCVAHIGIGKIFKKELPIEFKQIAICAGVEYEPMRVTSEMMHGCSPCDACHLLPVCDVDKCPLDGDVWVTKIK